MPELCGSSLWSGIQNRERHVRLTHRQRKLIRRHEVLAPAPALEGKIATRSCSRIEMTRPSRRRSAAEGAVPIEMQNVIGLAFSSRGAQRLVHRLKRWRTQDIQVHSPAHRRQTLDQRPRDHLVADVLETRGTRDHHQDPQHLTPRNRCRRTLDHERPINRGEIKRKRRCSFWIAEQLPRQTQERWRSRHDHQACLSLPRFEVGIMSGLAGTE